MFKITTVNTTILWFICKISIVSILVFSLAFQAHAASLSNLADVLQKIGNTLDLITLQSAPAGQVLGIDIDALTYPSLQSVQGYDDPVTAYNGGGIKDWGTNMVFLNIDKMGRNWIGHFPGQWGGMNGADFEEQGLLDDNGWITQVPSNITSATRVFSWSSAAPSARESREGAYVLTYEGEGDIRMWGGTSNEQIGDNKITFDLQGDQVWGYQIFSVTPGNHIRNVEIIREDRIPLYESGAIFNPEFLEIHKDVRQIRFMDWGATNNSDIVHFDEIADEDYYAYSSDAGVPISIMVKLVNQVGADPWFTFPFHFTDAAIQEYTEYVRDNLDPNLKAHFELSNEVWNFAFQQAQDANRLGSEEFNTSGGATWLNYYGKEASEAMKIVTDVYGDELSDRAVRVVGTQTVEPGRTGQIITAPIWETADPDNFVVPHTYFDTVAVTTYFGGSVVSNEEQRNAFFAATNRQEFLRQAFNEESNPVITSTPSDTFDRITALQTFLNDFDLDISIYEGPQHILHSFATQASDAEVDAMIEDMNAYIRSDDMADVYEWQFNEWKNIGGEGPFMQFSDVLRVSKYGAWGLRESLSDTSPRVEAFEGFNDTNTAWWENRSGTHFQHGRTVTGTTGDDTLAGTNQEDFLIGGDGEDILYAGPGDDGITGGPMEDVLMLRGNQSQYTVNSEGDGYRVVGPDGSDYVHAVEILYFEDGTTRALAGDINEGTGEVDPVDPDPVDPPRTYNLQNIKERMARNNTLQRDFRLRINRAANQCDVSRFEVKDEADVKNDDTRQYPLGLFDMTLECVGVGETVTQEIVLDAIYDTTDWQLVKYTDSTDEYITVNPELVTYVERDGVTVIEYEITDGGYLDDDGVANGVIVDPIGPAIPEEPEVPEDPEGSEETEANTGDSNGGSTNNPSSGSNSGGSSSNNTSSNSNSGGSSSGSGGSSSNSTPTNTAVNTSLPAVDLFKSNISFNQPSINSSVDVRNLQQFLNDFEGESLTLTGTYDSASNEAIKRFQRKYRKEILDVWDLTDATGYVGITTRLKMNFLLKGQTAQCPAFTEYNGGISPITISPEIQRTKQILSDLGMYAGPLDQVWTPQTHEAMIVFQETFREVMLDPWNISEGTGYKYKTTNKFLNYFAGCDTGAVELEGVGVYEGI